MAGGILMEEIMKVECTCGFLMESDRIKLRERRQKDGLIKVYYVCPKCKAEHHVCYHNSETKNLQKLIRRARNTGDRAKEEEYKGKLKIALDRLNNRL